MYIWSLIRDIIKDVYVFDGGFLLNINLLFDTAPYIGLIIIKNVSTTNDANVKSLPKIVPCHQWVYVPFINAAINTIVTIIPLTACIILMVIGLTRGYIHFVLSANISLNIISAPSIVADNPSFPCTDLKCGRLLFITITIITSYNIRPNPKDCSNQCIKTRFFLVILEDTYASPERQSDCFQHQQADLRFKFD